MSKYKQIIKEENYNNLLNSGLLFKFYPELKGNWKEDLKIMTPSEKPKPLGKINTDNLVSLCKDYIEAIEEGTTVLNVDHSIYKTVSEMIYQTALEAVYGESVWDWIDESHYNFRYTKNYSSNKNR